MKMYRVFFFLVFFGCFEDDYKFESSRSSKRLIIHLDLDNDHEGDDSSSIDQFHIYLL